MKIKFGFIWQDFLFLYIKVNLISFWKYYENGSLYVCMCQGCQEIWGNYCPGKVTNSQIALKVKSDHRWESRPGKSG